MSKKRAVSASILGQTKIPHGAKRPVWQCGRPVRYVTYYKDFLLDNKRKYTLSEWEVISTRTKTWRRPPNTIFEIAFKKRPLDLTGKWEYYKNFIPELQPRQSIPTLAKAPGATKHGAAYTAAPFLQKILWD